MLQDWDYLEFWSSEEWRTIEERLDKVEKEGKLLSPHRANIFKALDVCPFSQTKVIILNSSPYADPRIATGLAFSVPSSVLGKDFPPELRTILNLYHRDLSVDKNFKVPQVGDLIQWAEQGVLLWNIYPIIYKWQEWLTLTEELVFEASARGIVFVFLDKLSRRFIPYVDESESWVIKVTDLENSRLFSTINSYVVRLGYDPVDWRLG